VTKYTPYKAIRTGFDEKWAFGNINLKEGTDVDLEFSFRDKLTQEPVMLKNFYFTIFDLDHGKGQSERVTVTHFKNYTMLPNAVMKAVNNPGPYTNATFISVKEGDASNNPTSSADLTPEQMSLAVSFLFQNTDKFRLKLELLSGNLGAGRNFLFKGISTLTWQCV